MNLAMAREAEVCRSTSGYLLWSVHTATSRGPKADSSVLPERDRLCINEPRHEETNNVVSEQVRHIPSCKRTEDC